ncbi:MAG TPA: YfiR family protein [Chryseosolibacter sp.]
MPVLESVKKNVRYFFVRYATRWVLTITFLGLAIGVNVRAQESLPREYQIKAVFLYNFTQFVQWPAKAFPEENSPIVIGILGDDPFGAFIDETIQGEVVEDHPLVVERYASVDDIRDCHILFISLADKQEIRRAVESVRFKPSLTVSDNDGFTRLDGMIRFYNEAGRIKLRINVQATSQSNLTISSKLLRLAEIVPQQKN